MGWIPAFLLPRTLTVLPHGHLLPLTPQSYSSNANVTEGPALNPSSSPAPQKVKPALKNVLSVPHSRCVTVPLAQPSSGDPMESRSHA